MLAALIVISALCLSLTIISIHSTLNKKPQIITSEQNVDTEIKNNPANSIIAEKPAPSENDFKPDQNQGQPQRQQPQQPQPQSQSQQPQKTQPPQGTHSVPPETPPAPAKQPPSGTAVVTPQERPANNTNPARPPALVTPAPAAVTAVSKPVENKGTVVFVIDDAGNNLKELDPFFNFQGPLTMAVLPGLPYSAEAARRIRAAGKEVILHQPMEAIGGQNPGPGAIYSNMNADEIRAILKKNIDEVGPVKGINNHQGSKITMDSVMMQTILSFCKDNNLYYLDSRTTSDTVVPSVALKVGVKIAERNVFIDNEQNKDAMLRYITGGLTRAQNNGLVVMIGHTWSPALAPLLKEQYPLLIQQGYTIKTASDIVK